MAPMKRLSALALLVAGCTTAPPGPSGIQKLTSDGTHAEAYFSPDGKKLVLMALRAGDKADQIYTLDLATRALQRVTDGRGKTTCGYFLPGGRLVYSSTHHHGAEPPPPLDRSKGYGWPLHRTYDLFLRGADGAVKQLTDGDGYDAETTASPDGKRLVFTSHRDGAIGLWTMNADGTDLRRVTRRRGYAGGAFFSPDGQRLVYRAFYPQTAEEDAVLEKMHAERILRPVNLEIYTSRVDGSDERALTKNGKVNWAPTFHPDGRTVVFASNMDSSKPRYFALYLVGVDGTGLRRLTEREGFDCFPHFSPDGSKLVFISDRDGELNAYLADWR